jgi:hypothetical protein
MVPTLAELQKDSTWLWVCCEAQGCGHIAPMAIQSEEAKGSYHADCERFSDVLVGMQSRLDFTPGARGWCYLLENEGYITKGEFEDAEDKIVELRKDGYLPLDLVAADESREADFVDDPPDERDPKQFARDEINYLAKHGHESYSPISFWDHQPYYIEMTVEKIDLKSLFAPICEQYHVPLANPRRPAH